MGFAFALMGLALALFLATIAMIEVGHRAYFRREAAHLEPGGSAEAGLLAVEGAIFTLLGLMLAFTFSGAAERFTVRKQLVAQEANDIGTAWLRIELLPAVERPVLQAMVREYVDARIDSYRLEIDDPRTAAARERAAGLQDAIWLAAVEACPRASAATACSLLLGSVNDMINTTTTRRVATWIHPPAPVYAMLLGLVLSAGLLTGYGMAPSHERNWLHRVLFAAGITVAVYVTLDMEYPRLGLIRMDAVDQLLVDVRRGLDR